MNTELRVRLEGQLELVEQSIASLNTAFAALSTSAPTALTETVEFDASPEVARAEQAVRRLAVREPALTETLDTLELARRAFWARVHERARELGAPSARPQAVVAMLEAEPVVFAATLFSSSLFLSLGGAMLFTTVLALMRAPMPALVMPGLLLAVVSLLTVARSARVVTTRGRIVIRGEAIAFDSIRFMHARDVGRGTLRREVVLEIELRNGRLLERRLPSFPRALEEALGHAPFRAQFDYWMMGLGWRTARCPICARQGR